MVLASATNAGLMCSASCSGPVLQQAAAPLAQVVHVLIELWPGHHTWGRIWCHVVGALALRSGADLLAHVLAKACKLVLQLNAMLDVFAEAGLVAVLEECSLA